MTTQSKGYQFTAADAADLTALRTAYAAREAAGKDAATNPLAKSFLAAVQEFKAVVNTKVSEFHCVNDSRATYYSVTKQFAEGTQVLGETDRPSDMPLLMAELELVRGSEGLNKAFEAVKTSSKAYLGTVQVVNGLNGTVPVMLPY